MLFFKLPFDDQIYTVDAYSDATVVSFHPFAGFSELAFNGKIKKITTADFLNLNIDVSLLSELPAETDESRNDYCEKISDVISFVKEKQLPKLVISRRKKVLFDAQKFNCSQTFINLAKTYPNALVYFFVNDGQSWIGAFSEILGSFDRKTSFKTMALAGTLPKNEDWTSKEIEEQKPVADYILSILKTYSDRVEVSATTDHFSGNIKHLRTDFTAEIDGDTLENIIADLHPTPAVCGIPKETCQSAISDFEQHDRKFYAGYIRINLENSTHYFVNLRCAELFRNGLLVYVGGGITAESNPEKEWRETELKSEAIIKNLHFH